MVHVNVFVSAYIMCGGGGVVLVFLYLRTLLVIVVITFFFLFFLSRVKFGNRANGATGIWEKNTDCPSFSLACFNLNINRHKV